MMKRFFYSIILLLFTACSFQGGPKVSPTLEPAANYWEQLGNSVGQGVTPEIAFDANGKPFAAYSSGGFIYVREWSFGSWNLLGGVLAGSFADSPSLAVNSAGQPVIAYHEKINGSFNIYVRQWTGLDWVQVSGTLDVNLADDATFPSLDLDSTGKPTVAWQEFDGSTINAYVKRWDGSNWIAVGGAVDHNLANSAYEPQLVLDANNKPIVTWSESNGNIYVKRWNGTKWVRLGGALDITVADFSAFPSIDVAASGNPVVAWQECVNSCSTYNVYVKEWNGTSWLQVGGALDTTLSRNAENPVIAVNSAGKPTVLWREGLGFSDYDLYAKQWTGTTWKPLGAVLDITPSSNVLYPALTLDANANPAIIWQENDGSSDTLYVKRWLTNAWQPYGDTLDVNNSSYSALLPSLALTNSNLPVVAWYEYLGSEETVYAKYWNGQQWLRYTTVAFSGRRPSLALTSTNLPYVAFSKRNIDLSYSIFVNRWDGEDWIPVGTALNGGSADYPTLALDGLTRPVVAWEELQSNHSLGIYVKRWDGTTWQALGGALERDITKDGINPSIAIDSQDRPVVVWNERAGSSSVLNYNIYVKRWNGTAWQNLGGALDTSAANWAFQPTLAIDNTNSPVVAWEESNADTVNVYVKRWNGTAWVAMGGAVNNAGTNANTGALSLALDSSNNPVVAFAVRPGSVTTSNPDLFVKRWNGSAWVKMGGVVERFAEDTAGFPSLALTSQNKPIVAWHEQQGSGTTYSNPVVYVSGY
jgi:hypothetical protein